MQPLLLMLKAIIHNYKKAALAFIILSLLISAGCGKRKPPLPPVERVPQRIEISGFQRGNQIFIQWTMPARNANEGSVLNINRADLYRLIEPLNSAPNLSEEEFASRSNLIAAIPIDDADFAKKQLSYTDTLTFAGQNARIRYALRFVNANGQKAGFSNFILIDPTAAIAEAPSSLASRLTQDFVEISWKPPQQNIDGSTPVNILGYNIYRIDEKKSQILLNKSPITKNDFTDRQFEFEKSYSYFVRTVSLGTGGQPVESVDSSTITLQPKDTFAPAAPSAVTIAASPNTISIFFATNTERDIAGYRVYRSMSRDLPKDQWTLLTPQLLTANTFQDLNVESGKTYFYYLTAVDRYGNVSETSETVTESVP